MRINVYAEELTDRAEVITKQVDGKTFYGIRIYLELPVTVKKNERSLNVSGPFIHHEGDDDSSAITFWVPWTKALGNDFDKVLRTLRSMHALLREAQQEELSPAQ